MFVRRLSELRQHLLADGGPFAPEALDFLETEYRVKMKRDGVICPGHVEHRLGTGEGPAQAGPRPPMPLRRGVARGLAGWGGSGEPGVQPVPDFVRGVGAAAPVVADDHCPGRGHAREGGQSQRLVPAHLLRLEHVRCEYQPG